MGDTSSGAVDCCKILAPKPLYGEIVINKIAKKLTKIRNSIGDNPDSMLNAIYQTIDLIDKWFNKLREEYEAEIYPSNLIVAKHGKLKKGIEKNIDYFRAVMRPVFDIELKKLYDLIPKLHKNEDWCGLKNNLDYIKGWLRGLAGRMAYLQCRALDYECGDIGETSVEIWAFCSNNLNDCDP